MTQSPRLDFGNPPPPPASTPTIPAPAPVTGPPPFDAGPSPYATQEVTSYAQPPSSNEEAARRKQRKERARQRWEKARQSAAPAVAADIPETPYDIDDPGFIDFEQLPAADSPDWYGSRPLTAGQEMHVDHLLSVETDTMAREVLFGLKREGMPSEAYVSDFVSQFAEWGWDDLSSALALQVLAEVRDSDWDETIAQADWSPVETIAQDLGNNAREGLVIINANTGDILLKAPGVVTEDGSQYVGLQDTEVEALKGLPLIFVHNHTKDIGASDDDLLSAYEAGAELLIVITPSGREQVYIRGKDHMVLVRDDKASYKVGSPTLDETIALAKKAAEQAAAYREDPPELIFRQDDPSQLESEIHVPEGLTRKQAIELFRGYVNYDAYEEDLEMWTHSVKYLIQVWNKIWIADPSKGHDYGTLVELSPIILEQAKLWNHPDSGMSHIEVALWMFANLHQEARLRRTGGHVILPGGHMIFPGLPGFAQDPFGWFKDKLGDIVVFDDPSLGPANIRPTVADEILMEELRLPMPGGLVVSISDDQLGANRLDALNSLRAEWRNTGEDFGPLGHRSRVLFLSDNENAIKLMAINFYRGVERLVRLELPPTLFTLSAWQSQGIPEHGTLVNSDEQKALNAIKHAAQTSLYLNAITHHEESFGMDISAEEWKTIQIFEDEDFAAMRRYFLEGS